MHTLTSIVCLTNMNCNMKRFDRHLPWTRRGIDVDNTTTDPLLAERNCFGSERDDTTSCGIRYKLIK